MGKNKVKCKNKGTCHFGLFTLRTYNNLPLKGLNWEYKQYKVELYKTSTSHLMGMFHKALGHPHQVTTMPNASCGKALVNASAAFSWETTFSRLTQPLAKHSRMKWYHTPICLVFAWYIGFLAKAMALWLWHNNLGTCWGIPMSLANRDN